MNITWQDLINRIQDAAKKNPEVLQQTATVWTTQDTEYFAVVDTFITDEKTENVLDHGHFVISV